MTSRRGRGRPRRAGAAIAVAIVAVHSSLACTATPPEEPVIDTHVIPQPAELTVGEARYRIGPDTPVTVPPGPETEWLATYLVESLGLTTTVATSSAADDGIVLSLDGDADLGPEGYELSADGAGVRIRATGSAGLFYGVQTLRQLVADEPDGMASLPEVSVRDVPRYEWRGMMLDVTRHFFTVDEVEQLVDHLAAYKLNVLHLHLSDDQGWRLAIESRPALTEIGAASEVGEGPGGFYTQAEFADLVAYAAQRHVTVVPEIDLPGHTNAALVSYPELNCDGVAPEPYRGTEVGFSSLCVGKAETYAFVDDVIGEVAALMPGGYVHIGGDEALSTPPEDYATFVGKVLPIVAAHGKQPIGWQEIVNAPLPPGALVQYWDTRESGQAVAAVDAGARVVLSPADRVYLDMRYNDDWVLGNDWAALIEVKDAYDWEPDDLVPGVSGDAVAGVEAALWTEFIETMDDVEVMTFPRLPAVAEVAWSVPGRRSWENFAARLAAHGARWEADGTRFYASPQLKWESP